MEKLLNFLNKKYIFWIFLILGILMLFYPMILNPNLLPGDLGDTRFLNYILEHGYLFLTGMPNHSHFWDMPFYYPYDNTLAYSDMLIGGMVIYVPIRFLFHSPQDALQIFYLIVFSLNYLSFYLLERKIFKFSRFFSSIGAYIFAFGLIRACYMLNTQMQVQFYMIFAILFLLLIKKENSKIKNYSLFSMFIIFWAMELYTSFYLGWYMLYSFVVLFLIFICFKNYRKNIFGFIKKEYLALILGGVFFLILLSPLIYHYSLVGSKFSWDYIRIIDLKDFYKTISFLDDIVCFNIFSAQHPNAEHLISMGYLLMILAFVGFYKNKYRLQIFLFMTIIILTFCNSNLNYFLYNVFPGFSAIRNSGRIVFLLFPIFILGGLYYLSKIKNIKILLILITILIFEQYPYLHYFGWTKNEHNYNISQYEHPENCKIIEYNIPFSYRTAEEIMSIIDVIWLTIDNNIYTINGYSGYDPNKIDSSNIIKPECRLNMPFTMIQKYTHGNYMYF